MATESQKRLARQIHARFGDEIAEDCARSYVPQSLVAGFIGSEAGKDRQGDIVPDATRFEPHVFAHLKSLRDTGNTRNGKASYNSITQAHIKDASDAALKALATSYQLTQIMGWWMLVGKLRGWWPTERLDGTIAQLRDAEYHLEYAVILLEQSAGKYIKRGDFASVCKIWNTGSPTGKTYHENYVPNILAVKAAYEELTRKKPAPQPVLDGELDLNEADNLISTAPAVILNDELQQHRAGEIEATPEAPTQPAAQQVDIQAQAGALVEVQTPVQPVLPSPLDDPPVQVTTGGNKSLITTLATGIAGVPAMVWGFLQSNADIIKWVLIIGGFVGVAYIVRQIILDRERLRINSDQMKHNVK